MMGVCVRSPIRRRRRVHQPRNRGPAPAGARNARPNRPTWLPGGRTRRPGADGCRRWYKPGSRSHPKPSAAMRRSIAQNEARFPAHRLRRLVAAPNDAPFIAGAALARFAAPGGDKAARRAVFARHGIAEGVERRRGGRVDFRADIRAGNRVDLVAEDSPRRLAAQHNAD